MHLNQGETDISPDVKMWGPCGPLTFQMSEHRDVLQFLSFMTVNEASSGSGLLVDRKKQYDNVALGFRAQNS